MWISELQFPTPHSPNYKARNGSWFYETAYLKRLKKKKKSECKMSAKPKLMQIRFPCLLGDAYSAVWLLSVIFQLLTVVELHYRAKREAGGWNSLSPLHLKLHLILSSCLTLFLAQPVAGTVLLLFRFYKR